MPFFTPVMTLAPSDPKQITLARLTPLSSYPETIHSVIVGAAFSAIEKLPRK